MNGRVRRPPASSGALSPHVVVDLYGRTYHAGPSDRVLLGHSRAWVAGAAWAAMLAVGCAQYGYAVLSAGSAGGQEAAWGFAAFVACQSAVSVALAWLRRRFDLTPPKIVIAGAVGCAGGLLALGWAANPVFALAVYAVAAGLGAGLIYGTCVSVTAAWYPERPVRTAMVSGAFGYGAIPFIMMMATARDRNAAFGLLAWIILLIVATAAPLLREPPGGWWPAGIDPRQWALDKTINPALRLEQPRARDRSPAEVLRSADAWILAAVSLGIWAIALGDMSWLGAFGIKSGFDWRGSALGIAAFAAGSGGIRALAALAAERVSRPRILTVAACGAAVAQLLLLVAGTHRVLPLFWLAAGCAGSCAGTWFALLPGLVRSWFGDWPGLPNLWVVYCAKAAGGLLGAGCGGLLVSAAGFPTACVASAVVAGAVAFVPLRRRPGLPHTIPGIARKDRRSS